MIIFMAPYNLWSTRFLSGKVIPIYVPAIFQCLSSVCSSFHLYFGFRHFSSSQRHLSVSYSLSCVTRLSLLNFIIHTSKYTCMGNFHIKKKSLPLHLAPFQLLPWFLLPLVIKFLESICLHCQLSLHHLMVTFLNHSSVLAFLTITLKKLLSKLLASMLPRSIDHFLFFYLSPIS